MLSVALVIFREVFEIALIVSILMVATKGLNKRAQWVIIGVLIGIGGSVLIAFFADAISKAAQGMGQEMLNASILLIAATLIGWTTLWMNRHGRRLSENFKRIGQDITQGAKPIYTLAGVVALSVFREGAEIVMFTYSSFMTGEKIYQIIFGGLLGLCGGVTIGIILYYGLLKVPVKRIFKVTSWLLIFLVAGMVSQAFGYLVAVGAVSEIIPMVWDTSKIIAESSFLGKTLQVLVGYSDRPTGIQLLTYVLTLVGMGIILKIYEYSSVKKICNAMNQMMIVFLLGVGFILLNSPEVFATKKVYSPIVEKGEVEVEFRGGIDFDSRDSKNNKQVYKYALGYGVTERWFTEIYGETEKAAYDNDYEFVAVEWENRLQLFEQGKYWLDAGLYFAYETTVKEKTADKVEAKILLEKTFGNFLHTANIIFENEVGGGANNQMTAGLAWSSRYRWQKSFESGLEWYSDFGELGQSWAYRKQSHQVGPVFYGEIGEHIKYDIGYLFGLTDVAPEGRLKWILEYEHHF
jgi:high-affinity iron transporter